MNGTNSVRILGSSSDDIGYGVSVDSDDNIYLIADTEGGIDGFLNSGYSDIFLAKYNTSLDKVWSLQMVHQIMMCLKHLK